MRFYHFLETACRSTFVRGIIICSLRTSNTNIKYKCVFEAYLCKDKA